MDIAQDFWTILNFPQCFFAIDGKYVQIKVPPMSGHFLLLMMNYTGVDDSESLRIVFSQDRHLFEATFFFMAFANMSAHTLADLGK